MNRAERRRRTRRVVRRRVERMQVKAGDRWWSGWRRREIDEPGRHEKVAKPPVYRSDPMIPVPLSVRKAELTAEEQMCD